MHLHKPGGYMGKILLADLSISHFEVFSPTINDLRLYIGGTNLAAKYLYEMTDPQTDPLGPDNPLIFMVGPLTGTKVTTSSRHTIVSKSPLTGIWAESDVGGAWGVGLKRCGYDGLIIRGRSAAPSIIVISEDGCEIIDAGDVWGLDTFETDNTLKDRMGSKINVACIGPAGEMQVPISSIMHDGRHARAAGRCGLGAVMGSKLLKAVIVKPGTLKAIVYDQERLDNSLKKAIPVIKQKTARLRNHGTASGVIPNAELADMPAKNWSVGDWVEGARMISGEALTEQFLVKRYHCPGCVIGCGRTVKITKGAFAGTEAAGPEYESLAGLGSMCLIKDLEAVVEATDLCNRLGLDTISAGSVIAYAMEIFEKGLIGLADTGGVKLDWGNSAAVIWLLQRIANKEGIGELLGTGVKKSAELLGGLASEYAVHVKGLEFPFHDPRALSSLGLSYATYPRGACHRGCTHVLERGSLEELGFDRPLDRFGTERKAEAVIKMQDYTSNFNSLKLCSLILSAMKVGDVIEWLNAVTGFDYTQEEFLLVGERAFNLKRMYNVHCGISRKDDTLPPRITSLVFREGGAIGHAPHLGKMLSEYYHLRGWSEEGIPLPSKLRSLGLPEL